MRDVERLQSLNHCPHRFFTFGRVVSGGSKYGAALEVDSGNILDSERPDSGSIPANQPLEAILDAEDVEALVYRFDCGRRDDRVDSRRGAASYENRKSVG